MDGGEQKNKNGQKSTWRISSLSRLDSISLRVFFLYISFLFYAIVLCFRPQLVRNVFDSRLRKFSFYFPLFFSFFFP